MARIRAQILRSLDKLFPGACPPEVSLSRLSGLCGERISFQIAFCGEEQEYNKAEVPVKADSALPVSLYLVRNVPCELPAYADAHDDDYLTINPGLFPDPLFPLGDTVDAVKALWRAIWVEVSIPEDAAAGDYPVSVTIGDSETQLIISVIDAKLPVQEFCFTQWMHYDCIAQAHHVPIFSEAHWELIRKYVRMAVAHGVNMLLTPLFTPPLDTEVGGERPTVQLVGVSEKNGVYRFDFTLLARFIALCEGEGIRYFELSHLFTQWGAAHAPKIVVDGAVRFGWHTDAGAREYEEFLAAFLPALCAFLKKQGVFERVYFHVSDEPTAEQLPSYRRGRELVRRYAPDALVLDAISDFDFYQHGLIDRPVVALDHIEPFLEGEVPHLWGYVCCAQNVSVPNRFLAQPSARNRAVALPLFRFGIEGFLQWGFNFYNLQYSRGAIDPFRVTDAGFAFPGGDAFSVYPGEDGPIPSLRLKVFYEALCDLRAFSLLPREWVLARIGDCDFCRYPRTAGEILALRERVNREISRREKP